MHYVSGLIGTRCTARLKCTNSSAHRLRLWLDARFVDGDGGQYGRDSLYHLGSAAGSSPAGSPPCPPANLWPDDGLRSHRSLTSRMAASSGKESRGHSRNSNWKHTGTIPKRNDDSGAAKSGRLPISLSSRSPTSLLPVGCGSGHGRAAQPRRSSGKPGTVGGKKSSFGTVSGKSSVRQDILAMATFHTHQERRSIDFDAADLLPRLALLSATTNSCTAGMK